MFDSQTTAGLGDELGSSRRTRVSDDTGPSPRPDAAGTFGSSIADEVERRTDQYFRQHAGWLLSYCVSRLGSREEAEDALQLVYLNAFRALKHGAAPRHPGGWLFVVAKNVCHASLGARRRRASLELLYGPVELANTASVAAAPGRGPDDLASAVRALPENQRHALLLREWRGFSCGEIAVELGVSRGAVEMLLFRARRAMARTLSSEEASNGSVPSKLASRLGVAFVSIGALARVRDGLLAVSGAKTAATVAATVVAAPAITAGVAVHAKPVLAPVGAEEARSAVEVSSGAVGAPTAAESIAVAAVAAVQGVPPPGGSPAAVAPSGTSFAAAFDSAASPAGADVPDPGAEAAPAQEPDEEPVEEGTVNGPAAPEEPPADEGVADSSDGGAGGDSAPVEESGGPPASDADAPAAVDGAAGSGGDSSSDAEGSDLVPATPATPVENGTPAIPAIPATPATPATPASEPGGAQEESPDATPADAGTTT